VLDARGQSDVSTVVAGIQWAVNNRSAHNIRVMNLSLGHPAGESYTTDPLCRAVEQAWKDQVEAAGAEILDYVPEYVFKVRMNPAEARQVERRRHRGLG